MALLQALFHIKVLILITQGMHFHAVEVYRMETTVELCINLLSTCCGSVLSAAKCNLPPESVSSRHSGVRVL